MNRKSRLSWTIYSERGEVCPRRADIRIWTSKTTELAQLDIVDAGAGVDEADREKIFEPFYQGGACLTAT